VGAAHVPHPLTPHLKEQGTMMTAQFLHFEIDALSPCEYKITMVDRTTNKRIELPMNSSKSALFLNLYSRIQERLDFERLHFMGQSNQH